MGPSPILSQEDETHLKTWVIAKAKSGFGMHPDEVKGAVQKVLKVSKT